MLRGLFGVMRSVRVMTPCRVGMVGCLLVIARRMMFGGLFVMRRRVRVMLGGFSVMFCA